MPTGYTSDLYDGKPQTFEQFAMNCARAFGALVELRDRPDAEIPDQFSPSTYHIEAVAKAQARLTELSNLSDEECEAAALADYESQQIERGEERRKSEEMADRYETMLDHVRAWLPPTEEHEGLQQFMVEQLESSIKFDTTIVLPEPKRLTSYLWRSQEAGKAGANIAYHLAEDRKERERAEDRSEWVRALRESLQGGVRMVK